MGVAVSRYELFSAPDVLLRPIVRRGHDLQYQNIVNLDVSDAATTISLQIPPIVQAVSTAHIRSRQVILMLGGHLIKLGLSRFIIDLIEKGIITHVASNGAAVIHDYELAALGGTSEDVAKWVAAGQFGLWKETSQLNETIKEAARNQEGIGEAVGRTIEEQSMPHREVSIAAACWRAGIPFTCHPTIGADIIHAHPNCDGAALGQAAYTDFLIFARSIQDLEGGVFLNVGSAVTGPEVYLKALSMARNVAHQNGAEMRRFTTAVFDLVELPENWRDGPPGKDHPLYYYRPWKTILHRTVADGGRSFYVQGDFKDTIPAFWRGLRSQPL